MGVLEGLWPALATATLSFIFVDYFFVPPIHTLSITDEQDIVNLFAFAAIAGLVGLLASQRRKALLRAEALAHDLRQSNAELLHFNEEQAASAQAALNFSRSLAICQLRSALGEDRTQRCAELVGDGGQKIAAEAVHLLEGADLLLAAN